MAQKMLKRLSFTTESPAPAQLLPPPNYSTQPLGSPSGPRRSIDNASPQGSVRSLSAYPFPNTPHSPGGPPSPFVPIEPKPFVERAALHKSLAALSALLVAFDELRDAVSKTTKAEKKLAKAMRELATTFGGGSSSRTDPRNEIIVNALGSGANLFEALSEATSKLSKEAQKQYESANQCSADFFKSVAKAEKKYEDSTSHFESKMHKSTMTYERNLPKTRTLDPVSAAMDHDKYMTSIASLSAQVNATTAAHGEKMGAKREAAGKEVAKALCELAEASWRNRVDGTKAGAPKVGDVMAKSIWCAAGMPSTTYGSDTEDDTGVAQNSNAPTSAPLAQVKGPRPLPAVRPAENAADPARFSRQAQIDSPNEPAQRLQRQSAGPVPQQMNTARSTALPINRMQENLAHAPPAGALARSDTTSSRTSFVTKMKERYDREQEQPPQSRAHVGSEHTSNDSESGTGSVVERPLVDSSSPRSDRPPLAPLARSDSRVRSIAKEWESPTQANSNYHFPTGPALRTVGHRHTMSMQPLSTSSGRLAPLVGEFGQASSDKPQEASIVMLSGGTDMSAASAPPRPVPNQASRPMIRSADIIHADNCGCVSCLARKSVVEDLH